MGGPPPPPGALRRSQEDKEKSSGTGRKLRSHSFHHGNAAAASDKHTMLMRMRMRMQRPKTQPDLLSPAVGFRHPPNSGSGSGSDGRRTPAKLLVHVTMHSSLGPLQVMASADWRVDQLVAAALRLYINEGRRPLLPPSDSDPDPCHFGLHYSQFSLECLDPKEKLIDLGSRNFFLCPTSISASAIAAAAAAAAAASTTNSPPQSRPLSSPPSPSSCSEEAKKASKIAAIPWLRFINSLL